MRSRGGGQYILMYLYLNMLFCTIAEYIEFELGENHLLVS